MKRVRLACNVLAWAAAGGAWAAPVQVEQAMTLIRATCTLPNTALEIKPTAEGRLELRIALSNGQRRVVALGHADLDAFTEASAAVMASQPVALTGCMDPYIGEVISTLVTLPERAAPGSAPVAAAPYVPPVMAMAPPPPLPAPALVPAPATVVAQPPRPGYPVAGEMSVAAVLGMDMATPAAGGAAVATRPSGGVAFVITVCRASGRDVLCDIKASNESGKDSRLVVQGAFSKLYGEDGSQVQASWVQMGNQRGDMRHGTHEARLSLIADTAPVLTVHFGNVPTSLTAIKRLEISVGPQTANGVELQKITLADVQIQGR